MKPSTKVVLEVPSNFGHSASGLASARVGGQRPVRALILGGRVNHLAVESPRAREAAAGPAGGGGVAAELWGRVGASGLASARVGLRRHSLLT